MGPLGSEVSQTQAKHGTLTEREDMKMTPHIGTAFRRRGRFTTKGEERIIRVDTDMPGIRNRKLELEGSNARAPEPRASQALLMEESARG